LGQFLAILTAVYLNNSKQDFYLAEARMMIQPQATGPMSDPFGEEWVNFFGTQRTLMESPMIVDTAKAKLGDFVKRNTRNGVHPDVTLQVEILKGTSIFSLKSKSTDREYAIKFLDEVINEYIAYKKRVWNETVGGAQDSNAKTLKELKESYEAAERMLAEFQKTNSDDALLTDDHSRRLETLKEDVAKAKAFYENVANRINEVEKSQPRPQQELITVHQKAAASMQPIGASHAKVMIIFSMLGFIASTFLTIAVFVGRQIRSQNVRSPSNG
jgi:hypothetical protein